MTKLVLFPSRAWLDGDEEGYVRACIRRDDFGWDALQPQRLLTHFYSSAISSVIAVISVECASNTEITLPERNVRLFRKSLPYALEEDLLASSPDQHFALGRADDRRQASVTIISEAYLSHLVTSTAEANLKLDAVYVDAALLPDHAGSLSVLASQSGRCLCRAGASCWVMPEDQAGFPLPGYMESLGLSRINAYTEPDLPVPKWLDTNESTIPVSVEKLKGFTTETYLANCAENANAVNLLQGVFEPDDGSYAKRWIGFSIGTLAAAILLFAGYFWGIGLYFSSKAEAIDSQVVERYQEHFPESTRVFNVRKQIESHLRVASEPAAQKPGFVSFVSQLASAWERSEMTDAWMAHIKFDAETQKALIEIDSTSVPDVERLRNALLTTGFRSSILSATTSRTTPESLLIRLNAEKADSHAL